MGVKIMSLLEGLKGKGVELNTKSLARYTAENGVLVTLRCGRRRGRVSLPPKLLGLRPEKWDEGSKDFFADHVSMGQLTLVPKELDAKLNQLDTRARRLLQNYTINGSYMPLAQYQEFRQEFEEIRDEYLQTISKITGQWTEIRTEFMAGVRTTVEARAKRTMQKRDREKLIQETIRTIPTAREYEKGAYMKVEVRAFPCVAASSTGLAPDMQCLVDQTWRDDVVNNVVRAIETNMGELFEKACTAAKGYAKTQKIDSRSLNTLVNRAARVRKMNVFANPMLDSLAAQLEVLTTGSGDDETIEEVIEDAIVNIWEYAQATRINLDLSICPFSEDDLNNMLAIRAGVAAK